MSERETETRDGKIIRPDKDEAVVKVIDLGENFSSEKGSTPNHDKVIIEYIRPNS